MLLPAAFELIWIETVLIHSQTHDPLGDAEKPCRLRHIPFGGFQRIKNQLPLQIVNGLRQSGVELGAGGFGRLKCRR